MYTVNNKTDIQKPFENVVALFHYDSHEEIRKFFSWKSYGKDGKQPGTWLVLKDMETEHIKNILLTQKHISATVVHQLFIDELNYRGIEHGD